MSISKQAFKSSLASTYINKEKIKGFNSPEDLLHGYIMHKMKKKNGEPYIYFLRNNSTEAKRIAQEVLDIRNGVKRHVITKQYSQIIDGVIQHYF
jgi:cobalamin biosynthesis protein CbiG